MRLSPDLAAGEWIRARLHGRRVVGGYVPRGYPAYVRVFHPAKARHRVSGATASTWATIARASGATPHPAMQWTSISAGLGRAWEIEEPYEGALPPQELSALAGALGAYTTTPDDVVAGVWEGWGDLSGGRSVAVLVPDGTEADREAAQAEAERELDESVDPAIRQAVSTGPFLELPDRRYLLFTTSVPELADPDWVWTARLGWSDRLTGVMPNLLWPRDRAWFLASEIDFDSTLVACSQDAAAALLALPGIEAGLVDEDTDI